MGLSGVLGSTTTMTIDVGLTAAMDHRCGRSVGPPAADSQLAGRYDQE
jgi:hypothetical protein